LALYGVRVSSIGAPFVPFGTRMNVFNFTPSRIGIITSRLSKLNASLRGLNEAGVSLGNAAGALSAARASCPSVAPSKRATKTVNGRANRISRLLPSSSPEQRSSRDGFYWRRAGPTDRFGAPGMAARRIEPDAADRPVNAVTGFTCASEHLIES